MSHKEDQCGSRLSRIQAVSCTFSTIHVYFKFLVFAGEIMLEDNMAKYVAVKILKEGVSREAKEDFKREVEIMSAFDHENILKLIGVVAIGENFYDCYRPQTKFPAR